MISQTIGAGGNAGRSSGGLGRLDKLEPDTCIARSLAITISEGPDTSLPDGSIGSYMVYTWA